MINLKTSRQYGATVVEFAIILPLLVMLVFGITELGRAIYQLNMLSKSVEVGARYLSRGFEMLSVDDGCTTSGNAAWNAALPTASNLMVYGVPGPITTEEPLFAAMATDDDGDGVADAFTITASRQTVAAGGVTVDACFIKVTANIDFNSIFGAGADYVPFFGGGITFTATSEERYLGE